MYVVILRLEIIDVNIYSRICSSCLSIREV